LGEHVKFSADSVQLMYFPQKADGTLDAPVTQSFAC
jgi:hypothetical protein